MTKIITSLVVVILFSCTCFAQITEAKKVEPRKVIGKVDGIGPFAEISYEVEDDTTFLLMYKNARYSTLTDINSIAFKGGMDVINVLYANMTSVFSEENKKNKKFEVEFILGETHVFISGERAMGIIYMRFYTSDGYFYLNQKQVDKLFGK